VLCKLKAAQVQQNSLGQEDNIENTMMDVMNHLNKLEMEKEEEEKIKQVIMDRFH